MMPMVRSLSLALLLLGGAWVSLAQAGGTKTERTTLVEGVTTNTTSAAFLIPAGVKSIYAQVVGTGAVTQDVALFGDIDNDAANGVLLCSITLSGTTRAQDACPPFPANFSWFYIITTNTTGTSATGAVYAMY